MSSLDCRKYLQYIEQNPQKRISGPNIPFMEVTSTSWECVYDNGFFPGFYQHAVDLLKNQIFLRWSIKFGVTKIQNTRKKSDENIENFCINQIYFNIKTRNSLNLAQLYMWEHGFNNILQLWEQKYNQTLQGPEPES